LTGAHHLNYGGAPQGPAGTGKTETTKDLAKALAIQCVVFNCSDGLDYKIMGRFFCGLAHAGAWSCFDEFNRIDIEVLSVIAQQIMTIQNAIRQKVENFEFEGKTVPLNHRFGVFITMNPGYAGRTELPDNLKSLFRPVAMMIPDYALIAEIILFSVGFETAHSLARKMVQLYRLASEQLSKQDHYDFGMRAVKSVLVMAGALRSKNLHTPEDELLIRAMRDSNVPKFLAHDLPLFTGIINDLFPGVKPQKVDYGDLQEAIEGELEDAELQRVSPFVTKIIQLYETLQVRHGIMVVGSTGTGKTTCIKTLAKALTRLYHDGSEDFYHKMVHLYPLNPKAVKMSELYGSFNLLTNEWTDGLIAEIVRHAVADQTEDKKWVLFDGPVDALWIENMNTVLDDNKTLCLANSERIKLPNTLTMMFEVQDLKVASPATVSRCGMVYLEPEHLGWEPLVDSWAYEMESRLGERADLLVGYIKTFVTKGLAFVREDCDEMIESVDMNLVQSCLNLCSALITAEIEEAPEHHRDNLIRINFIFSFVWSIGANLDDNSRVRFSKWARLHIQTIYPEYPSTGEVYDYCVNTQYRKFANWSERIETFVYDEEVPYFNILVPTVDTCRYKYLLKTLVENGNNVLFMGDTGVGKSVIINDFLNHDAGESYVNTMVNFSAQTTSTNLQDVFETKLEKKKKNLMGPPAGKTMLLFVDDVNMPQLDTYGSQPPNELFRQAIDLHGFYDRKKLFLKYIKNVQFLAACAPPGGGRNPVSPRLFRHFNMFWLPQLSSKSMKHIFTSILEGFLAKNAKNPELADSAAPIVAASVDMYLKLSTELLPTPTKSHYTFNLRDLSKLVQGILQTRYEDANLRGNLISLWLHESCRVFRDRLVDEKDKEWFNESMSYFARKHVEYDESREKWVDNLYGSYVNEEGAYKKIEAIEHASECFQDALSEYNRTHSAQMDLVFFKDAIHHLSRIIRILKQPRGNALLIGVGGSGRQSLAKLATKMAQYKLFQIEITKTYGKKEFKEDLKTLLQRAGMKRDRTVFLFSDTQIVDNSFLEDINNILNTGEVPNLYDAAEMEEIIDEVRPVAKEAGRIDTPDSIKQHFVQLVRENLHIVLAFSPVGDSFRDRVRQFPSVINCCTIDWFTPWPNDALYSVAEKFYSSKKDLGISSHIKSLCQLSVEMHMSVKNASEKFYKELRRRNYTTPTSYLELLKLYAEMLKTQLDIIPGKIKKYKVGLEKLAETNEYVESLKVQLIELQPILERSSKDVADSMVVLQAEQKIAAEAEALCKSEAAETQNQTNQVEAIRDDCQKDLDEAMPEYNRAVKAVECLRKEDIVELKSFLNPNEVVVHVMETVCILFKIKKPSWDEAKKLLGRMDFLQSLYDYKKDEVSNQMLSRLKERLENPKFNLEKVRSVSKAATTIAVWVTAIDKYAKIKRKIAPKEKVLREAEEDLRVAQERLNEKQEKLRVVQEKVAGLKRDYEDRERELHELQERKDKTEIQLDRAEKLVTGLGSEQIRWRQSMAALDEDLKNLVGNIIVAAGFVAYLGPFTTQYRNDLMKGWLRHARIDRIPVSREFELETVLGDPVQIREWNIQGLPGDSLSVNNALIVTYARRWPLIIDPQTQANKWIRNMCKEQKLQVTKFSDPHLMRKLDSAIRYGTPVLMENIEETVDPSLDSLLLKSVYKKGSQLQIKLGDADIPYNMDFKFYLTSKLPNPHYLPETCIKVTVINFTVTAQGLEDQLLVDVVRSERPDLEKLKDELIIQIADDKRQLQDLEDKILKLIGDAQDILEDEELINTLAASKATSEAINQRMGEAEKTANEINTAREQYRPVATRGSILYFVIADMSLVDPMYQYSLDFFNNLFNLRLKKAEQSKEVDERIAILINDLTKSFYRNICRGLFEKDKLLYSFLTAVKINLKSETISPQEWNFFLRGSTEDFSGKNFEEDWIEEKVWHRILGLEGVDSLFKGLAGSISGSGSKVIWKEIMKADEPWTVDLPSPFNACLSGFQKLMVLKTLREEKAIFMIKNFIVDELGKNFIESPPFDLAGAFEDSGITMPLIFILSPGADPINYLINLAKVQEMDMRLNILSLGQGQGPRAEQLITKGRLNGDWVCLQNCHLAASWMADLEKIQENIDLEETHPDYRLWLTSMPSSTFPVPVLQSGIKLTNEPPKGLKANLNRTYQDITAAEYESSSKGFEYKRLLFGLAFFHAVILERRKFGAIGWNIPYEWMNSDLEICKRQLKMYLEEQNEVPFETLNVVVSEINYGGRVTDDKDERLIRALLRNYFRPQIFEETFKFDPSGIYYPPENTKIDVIRDYIHTLPLDENPEVFGLHPNANIIFQQNTSNQLVGTVVSIQPRIGTSSGDSPDVVAMNLAKDFESRLPKLLKTKDCHPDTFALTQDGSMNCMGVFLSQELSRFNALLRIMVTSLRDLQKAIKGLVVMSMDLEKIYDSFLNGRVPVMWEKAAYPSLKPLGDWVTDLIERVEFLADWIQNGPPKSYWLSAFFFPQGFMTAARQTYARKTATPIDTLVFRTEIQSEDKSKLTMPENGVYIHGLFLQGAKWDSEKGQVGESDPGVQFFYMPVIWLDPVTLDKYVDRNHFKCPLYKTSLRRGTLSTTGHSTNFVLELDLDTSEDPLHWTRRGVALLCQPE